MLLIVLIVILLASVVAWINTKIIIEDLNEIKADLARLKEGRAGEGQADPSGDDGRKGG